jgi:hypothetical protein
MMLGLIQVVDLRLLLLRAVPLHLQPECLSCGSYLQARVQMQAGYAACN